MTPRGPSEQDVWAQEVASWEFLKAGDLTSYLGLLHEDVMAWPDGRSAPLGKNAIFQLLVAILPTLQTRGLTVELKPLSITVFDDVAVVHYEGRTRSASTPGPGPAYAQTKRYTRTWLRSQHGWRLIAAMNALVNPQSA